MLCTSQPMLLLSCLMLQVLLQSWVCSGTKGTVGLRRCLQVFWLFPRIPSLDFEAWGFFCFVYRDSGVWPYSFSRGICFSCKTFEAFG